MSKPDGSSDIEGPSVGRPDIDCYGLSMSSRVCVASVTGSAGTGTLPGQPHTGERQHCRVDSMSIRVPHYHRVVSMVAIT